MGGLGGFQRRRAHLADDPDAAHGAYRKLRNTFRYVLGNSHDFDPATDAVPAAEMAEIDQWILLRAEDLVARCRAWYDEFAFHKVYHAVYDFARWT